MTPQKPSFAFSYWRPWNENSSVFDSYLDYIKDTSIVKYGADIIGQYIESASSEQIESIKNLSQEIGYGFNIISQQLESINENLIFLNQKLDIQIEQQRLNNLLLQEISELLKIPDKEKERYQAINLGLKFFINSQYNPELFWDSLSEFLKAESLMSQDYFVLNRIGYIYLYAPNLINPSKSLEYFERAAKYSVVESKPTSARFINILTSGRIKSDLNLNTNNNKILYHGSTLGKIPTIKIISEKFKLSINDVKIIYENNNQSIFINQTIKEAENLKNELDKIGITIKVLSYDIDNNYDDVFSNSPIYIDYIKSIASDSLEKAAFSAYIIGQFEKSVNLQKSSINYFSSPEKLFILSKYLIRNNQLNEALDKLNEAINIKPILAIGIFNDIDLMSKESVIELVRAKHKEINTKIENLINLTYTLNHASDDRQILLKELETLRTSSYEKKITDFEKLENRYLNIRKSIVAFENNINDYHSKIDRLIIQVRDFLYQTFTQEKIESLICELIEAKSKNSEEMIKVFEKINLEVEADRVKVGVKYGGGIVFHVDVNGRQGLICSENDLGKHIWGISGLFLDATRREIGEGNYNTNLICEKASDKIEKGFFSSKKIKIINSGNTCKAFSQNGFSDWYLPSLDELKKIFNILHKKGLGDFSNSNYWSSTEYDANEAYRVNFSSGDVVGIKKDKECKIRAIRSF